MTERTVGEVARLTGLSVRTLHHYDDIGLVEPGVRSASGYRIYSDDGLARLHRVCTYRELVSGTTPSNDPIPREPRGGRSTCPAGRGIKPCSEP